MLKFYTHFVLKRLQYTFKLSLICCICENSIKYNVNIKDEKINIIFLILLIFHQSDFPLTYCPG